MAENEPGPEPLEEDARLRALDERLARARTEEAVRTGAAREAEGGQYRMGNRVLAELIGGMVGGAVIGWVIDQFAGTSPWALLVMLALGVVVAFRNIIRISSRPPE
ncbi:MULTISPECIES: AtpZ/AtpI family protein [unclassified Sphingomonas]|jgi:ATP synthase protein I|uniref:AtpZ/AtpI family protein n=1 Tax=unclassified Sphingomonas TaxID=196159 RepID=UPI000835C77D|nr:MULTISPECIES: AtpZ/AtpI family protein [unclassified Sphingomonas]MCH4892169.1 F0F1 ATP synthase assembly protein I [Sphingomonas sp. SFZ2018-12]